jgi:hypothetical protein
MEIAGAFGDLGTLIPFISAYIGILKMDPFGVLLAFGISMIVCGVVYRPNGIAVLGFGTNRNYRNQFRSRL